MHFIINVFDIGCYRVLMIDLERKRSNIIRFSLFIVIFTMNNLFI